MIAWWMVVAGAWAGPPQVPASQRVELGAPPALCLSSVPSAGRIRRKDRALWVEAAAHLGASGADADAVEGWWREHEEARRAVRPHPAWQALDGVVAEILGRSPEVDLASLAASHLTDACLAQTAAVIAWRQGDDEAARRIVSRAWMAGGNADLAWLLATRIVPDDALERRADILDKGLQLSPEHGPLRRLRAEVALARGETEGVEADLSWLREAGDRSLDQRLMQVRYRQGQMDAYLRLALASDPPVGAASSLDAEGATLQGFRQALGLSSSTQTLRATLLTDEGEIRCDLLVDEAPITVANFVGLATGEQPWTDPETGEPGEGPLYEDVLFHRAIPGFMAQTGDPTGTGKGGPGYRFHDEIMPSRRFDRPGLLAMANSGPATNGSQFFITEAATEHLTGRHTIFGECVDVGVVQQITRAPRDGQDAPVSPVRLREIQVEVLGR